MKIIIFFISMLFIYSCSLNTDSAYWDKKNTNFKIVKQTSNKTEDGDFKEIKNQIIEYGKKSSFPSIED